MMIKGGPQNSILITLLFILSFSCKKAQDLKAFTEADYKLQGVENVMLNESDVSNRKSLYDFRTGEGDSLMQAFNSNQLRLSGVLHLRVDMPEPEEVRTMQVEQLKWQLLVDGKETLEGIVAEPMLLQNGLNKLPFNSSVVLAEVDGFQNYEGFSKLTTLLSQNQGLQKSITFRIKPTINTPFGNIEVPNYITVSKPSGT